MGAIAASLSRQIARGLTTQADADATLARITAVTSLADAAKADLVIEAAVEDEAVKKAILSDLLPHLAPTPCWRPTPRRSRSPGWPRRPTGPTASSACIS
jgi:3-hydroxyacyl-CoA dehydrogenase